VVSFLVFAVCPFSYKYKQIKHNTLLLFDAPASNGAVLEATTTNVAKIQTILCSYWMHQLQMLLVLSTVPATVHP
jgi:hypothetical protein